MALKLTLTGCPPSAREASYWVVAGAFETARRGSNAGAQRLVTIGLEGYADEQARRAGAPPITTAAVLARTHGIEPVIAKVDLYAILKQRPEWAPAEDA